MSDTFDAIVIGSGGGLKIVEACADRGLKAVLVEESAFGGTCLNRGCIPSKMMIYPAARLEAMRDAGRLGLRVQGHVDADFPAIMARVCREIDGTSHEILERLNRLNGITVVQGSARFAGERTVEVAGRRLTAPRVFIATGSRPRIPNIAGLADTPYMTSREALRNRTLPRRMIVMGAGYIAAELGFAYAAYGTDVAFIVRSRFLRAEDVEIAREFERVFCARHVIHEGFHTESVVYENGEFCLRGHSADGAMTDIRGDALLVATGVVPETERLGLDLAGVDRDSIGNVVVDECLNTTADGVYALGDVIGRNLYRHTVNYEAEYLIRTVLDGEAAAPLEYGPVPHAVFAEPQIAGVGETQESAESKGIPLMVGKATYADSTPGMAYRSDHGLCKVLVDARTHRIVGAHIVGDEAANMLHLFIAAMKKESTLHDMLGMIFIHPALPEVARDALRDAARCLAAP